ncbi:MAG: dihydroorotase [Candidatus Gastranaerophilales bacterium]|nr:dihydroorotase [Candidatus Gastranaerophilales bacterium]
MLLIQNGYMIDPKSGHEGKYDILVKGDTIEAIGKSLPKPRAGCRVLDAEGLLVAPGLVDVHVHFREPGFTQKEDIDTGVRAAAKGGFTSVVMMANTKPPVDNEDTLKLVLDRGSGTPIHVYACANVTKGMKGQELTEMEKLMEVGACGFTDDGMPLLDARLAQAAMERAAALDMPISFHEEDPALIRNNGVNQGKASEHFQIGGSPREAEIALVERDLKLAARTGAIVNIQHISAKESVELVRRAKKGQMNIHAEATPHHFTLTEEAVIQYGALAKMNPPLREEEDRQAIIRGLVDGTIDMIATDHAPHTAQEKALPITQAPSGIIGLETALSLGITKLVDGGYLTMRELLQKMSTNPAAMYHFNAGYLAEGGPADIVLIDTAATVIVEEFASKASNSPFVGWELKGKVIATICGGKIVYSCPD